MAHLIVIIIIIIIGIIYNALCFFIFFCCGIWASCSFAITMNKSSQHLLHIAMQKWKDHLKDTHAVEAS